MGQSRPLFVYFFSFHIPIQMTNIQFEQSIDGVLGTRTWVSRMEGTDESTELWRHPVVVANCPFTVTALNWVIDFVTSQECLTFFLPYCPCTLWPDLAKFCNFGEHFKILGNFLSVSFIFGKIVNLLWTFLWYWTKCSLL